MTQKPEALSVDCPRCGAWPWVKCRTHLGRKTLHKERVLKALNPPQDKNMKPDPFNSVLHEVEHIIDQAQATAREVAVHFVREALSPFNLRKRRIWVMNSFLHVDNIPYWQLRNNEDIPVLLALYQVGSFIESLDEFKISLSDVIIQEPTT